MVDDNVDAAMMLERLLQLNGKQTRVAHSGLDALEVAEQFRPHLVLLDIGLPKLNGYEVCRRIRQQPWGKDMVVIALTGWGQEEDRRAIERGGLQCALRKAPGARGADDGAGREVSGGGVSEGPRTPQLRVACGYAREDRQHGSLGLPSACGVARSLRLRAVTGW